MNVLRRNPGTAVYLALVLLVSVIVLGVLPADARDAALRAVSTDVANANWSFPLRLVGSVFVLDLSGGVLPAAAVLIVGVAGCLGWLERRFRTGTAFGIFFAAHTGATLVTLLVVVAAIPAGYYPDGVRDALDYGISYGALGCVGAVTFFLPKRVRLPWAVTALILPFLGVVWYGWLPDFSTVGHVVSVLFGLAVSRRWAYTRAVGPRIL